MPDKFPFHIQEEIIKRLPIRSLVKFRCVSQAWKSLIDSSDFVLAHSVTQPQHLLLRYEDPVETTDKYVTFLDDDTFPQQRFVHPLPRSVKLLKPSSFIGSSHGLFCLHGFYSNRDDCFPNLEASVLFNPSVRKSIVVPMPKKDHEFYKSHESVLGFGVFPNTNDPFVIQITQFRMLEKRSETSDPWKVDVYTLSSGNWRSLSRNLRSKSFGVTDNDRYVSVVWMMENNVEKSFTKLFKIKMPFRSIVLGFRKSGEAIMEVENSDDYTFEQSKLVVYDPNLDQFNDVDISGTSESFFYEILH